MPSENEAFKTWRELCLCLHTHADPQDFDSFVDPFGPNAINSSPGIASPGRIGGGVQSQSLGAGSKSPSKPSVGASGSRLVNSRVAGKAKATESGNFYVVRGQETAFQCANRCADRNFRSRTYALIGLVLDSELKRSTGGLELSQDRPTIFLIALHSFIDFCLISLRDAQVDNLIDIVALQNLPQNRDMAKEFKYEMWGLLRVLRSNEALELNGADDPDNRFQLPADFPAGYGYLLQLPETEPDASLFRSMLRSIYREQETELTSTIRPWVVLLFPKDIDVRLAQSFFLKIMLTEKQFLQEQDIFTEVQFNVVAYDSWTHVIFVLPAQVKIWEEPSMVVYRVNSRAVTKTVLEEGVYVC
ncbi:hypothetical protein C8J56DRAFT_1062424 [Mycena floridula]|nr:hypothetical protein C8J56DRAFT_1062424 [Mycena floridula]